MGGNKDANKLAWFLQQTQQWSDQQQLVLGSATEFRDVVNTLTDLVPDHSSTHRRTSCESFPELARYYGSVVQFRAQKWQRDEYWNSFQRLIFFSLCLVLHKQYQWAENEVDALMSWTSPRMDVRKQFRRGTERIHRVISNLVNEGWSTSRATELFLMVPLPLWRLRVLSGNIKNPGNLTAKLVNPDGPNSAQNLTLSTNLTFPALIRKVCTAYSIDLSLQEICSALGYKSTESFPTCVDKVMVAIPSSTPSQELRIRIHSLEGDVNGTASLPRQQPSDATCSRRSLKKRKRLNPKATKASQSDPATDQEHQTNSRPKGILSTTVPAGSSDDPLLESLVKLIRNLGVECFAEELLMRASNEQYRWDSDGRGVTVHLQDTRLSPGCAALFNSRNKLRSLLGMGVQSGRLGMQLDGDDRLYSVSDENPDRFECDHEYRDSLILACHIWPRDPPLEPSASVTQSQLLPTVRKLFGRLQGQIWRSLDIGIQRDIVEVWISASSTTRSSLGGGIVALAQDLKLQAPSYIYLELVKAQSVLLRRQERYKESGELIEAALQSAHPSDVRTHCAIGLLRLSEAENAILQNDFARATFLTDEVSLTMPDDRDSDSPALMQYFRLQLWTLKGRLYRYQGDFENATEALEICVGLRHYSSGLSAYGVVRQLADSYTELKKPSKAVSLLEEHLEYMRKECKQGSRLFNRLSLSKADAYLAMGRLSEAQTVLEGVQQSFVQAPAKTQTDQLDHVRAVLASMRKSMYEEAWAQVRDCADKAVELAQRYSCFTETNYYKGYALRARATALLHLARADMDSAEGCVRGPKHFMVGLGTYDLKMALSHYQQKWEACAELTSVSESLAAYDTH